MSLSRNPVRSMTVVFRLTLLYAVLSALFCVGVFAFVSSRLKDDGLKRVDRMLQDELHEFVDILNDRGLPGLQDEFDVEVEAVGSARVFCLLCASNNTVLLSSDLADWAEVDVIGQICGIRLLPEEQIGFRSVFKASPALHARVASVQAAPFGTLHLGMSLKREDESFARTQSILSLGLLLMVALSTLTGMWIIRRAMSGVRRVTSTVAGIRKDSLHRQVETGREGREIVELAEAFNQMLRRIETLVRELHEVSDNVAHDLRSPITRMRGAAETTLTGPQELALYRDMALLVLEEADRLTEVINTMLEIAQSEAGVLQIEMQDADLIEILKNAIELFSTVAEEKEIQITSNLPGGECVIRADKSRLQRVTANLLDNAVKYTPPCGKIEVALQVMENSVQIAVQDSGIGIAKEEQSRIFERFYRSEKSRTSHGNGLGLSLASSIVYAHGGSIRVFSEPGKGSTFFVELPIE